MAYSLYSTPSSLVHERQSLSHSISSQRKPCLRTLNSSPKLGFVSSQAQPRPSLQTTHDSVHDPTTQQSQSESLGEEAKPRDPNGKPASKSYVWVNPRSPRATQFRKKSYESRYTTLVKVAESLNDCKADEDEVSKVLDSLGPKVLEQDAVVVINNMVNQDTATLALKYFQKNSEIKKEVIFYNVTMKVFRKSKNLEGAEKLFDEMIERGVTPDNVTFSTLISCARVANQPDRAVEWFEKMGDFNCEPDDVTYSAMIDAYGRAGNVEMAFSLYDRARSQKWRIDPVTFSTLIKIHGQSENYDGCLNMYEEMKAIGAKPNLVIYNTLLDAMGKAKRPWQAKKLHLEMLNSGLLPNSKTYSALLRAFGKARYGDDCINVYREMKEKGIEMNAILYNTILSMCADIGYTDEAIEIFNDMKSSLTKPDSWTYSSMLTIYSCHGQVEEAEATLNEMIQVGYEPTKYVLTSLIQCYGKAKRIDDVVRTYNQLLELDISPDERFCACLLNVMTQSPKEELSKLTACVEKAYPKLGQVVKLLLEEEDDKVEVFTNETSELFSVIGADVRKAYCNCLIDLCVNLDLLNKASKLLDLGLSQEVYTDLQTKNQTQWSLNLKGLSLGAALTALHVWIGDLTKALESGEELPPVLGINTGHGKHKYSDKGLAGAFESRLRELDAPFHEAPEKAGWFLTTHVAVKPWLDSIGSSSEETFA